MSDPLQTFGAVFETENGVSRILPHEQSVAVHHGAGGEVLLALSETGRPTVVFHLSTQQAQALARRLVSK